MPPLPYHEPPPTARRVPSRENVTEYGAQGVRSVRTTRMTFLSVRCRQGQGPPSEAAPPCERRGSRPAPACDSGPQPAAAPATAAVTCAWTYTPGRTGQPAACQLVGHSG